MNMQNSLKEFTSVIPKMDAMHKTRPVFSQPSLNSVLAGFGPMPEEAMFIGVASDELPLLLNLHDPIPGPLLIIGDPGTGKTSLLQTIAQAVGRMHKPEKVQFGVMTRHPDEWNGFEGIRNNVGIFSIHHKASEDFILSLASWAHGNRSGQQSVLLLLDDLEAITYMDLDAVQNLRWLLMHGPARRVWPIITLSTQDIESVEAWLGAFRTRIIGSIYSSRLVRKLGAEQAYLNSMEKGQEFTLREGDGWVRFWIPSL